MGVWFIEANAMLFIYGFTEGTTKKLNHRIIDTFEINYGLLRSRMKRVVEYINNLNKEIVKSGEKVIPNSREKREEFKELTMNRFEPEFASRPGNGFINIGDENELGMNRYSGLLEASCFENK